MEIVGTLMSQTQTINPLTLNEDGELPVYNYGTLITNSSDYGSSQTRTELIPSPGAGKHIEIHDIYISSSANSGEVVIEDGTSFNLLFKKYIKASEGTNSGFIHSDAEENESVVISCPANTFIAITYHIESS